MRDVKGVKVASSRSNRIILQVALVIILQCKWLKCQHCKHHKLLLYCNIINSVSDRIVSNVCILLKVIHVV